MQSKRVAAGLLSTFLGVLLVWMVAQGLAGRRIQVVIGIGAGLGFVYATFGQVPGWFLAVSGSSITADDDPANISPRVYLPILAGAILIACILFFISRR